ncbi:MAG: N-acetylmuramoyl-L-alanine amidase family protein [Limisphaerales bacterium]
MKIALCLGLIAAGSLAAPAQAPVDRWERVPLFGHEYVRLSDWARAEGFELVWRRNHEQLVLSNRWAQLEFTVDSRKAAINGVNVHLSFPIAHANGVAYISPLDLKTLVQPILFPKKDRSRRQLRVICLDPGHGGKDPGNQAGGHSEKKYTLLLAQEVRRELARAGMKGVLTRNTDRFVELSGRPALARSQGAELFLCLHFNSTDVPQVRGVEVYCMTPVGASSTNARGEGANSGAFTGNLQDAKNVLLAYELQKAIVRDLGLEDRGVRRARFGMLRPAEMPAVLIEGGFMTNPGEAKKIYDPVYRRELAQAIVDGILAYRRLEGR